MAGYVLAIDQGTTSSRAILLDAGYRVVALDQREFEQHFPRSGWVEHEPEDIWNTTLATCRGAMAKAGAAAKDIAAIGITNQRETTVVWDRQTGKAIHRAIVWQDRRTADICAGLKQAGRYQLEWNGKDVSGEQVVSGIYYCLLKSGKAIVIQKMILIQ